ncbi:MAG: type IV pilus twitching motility protein PilT [Nitrospina sp.]|nr:type IV pilus twitching motility protein PilT [Nitrospina sp.]MBT3415169.1 type IV pilus twitching motility protein PilT [Nitrospina sp.]MBT3855414.1 type IV pilus twitching motility protein PilT [Nitrospina sp.]MBT4106040.1 type IV pilus twitching motility protein PilT [Nitrospina sp.]MBT4388490.1 type IV pilus twitching motility protein PilT [Nitrospina sp.]
MAKIDAFFKLMNEQGASDLHLISGSQPILRVHGDMERVKYKALENDELKAMLYEIAPENKIKVFEETGDVDFAYEIPNLARYRANYFQQKWGVGAVFREIPSTILTAEQLGLPKVITKLSMLHKGMVLVTGPTGSGKSTTLAAMMDYVNRNKKSHIITVEDPVEFVHKSQSCIVNHREVGVHTKGFKSALRGALREDPDIILVGEMRDLETIELALEAASTGHLVFGTLHTQSAAKTVDRIIDVFPAHQQSQIRTTLSESLKGVIAQNLFKRIDKKGRMAVLEVLVVTPAVSNLIREGKTFQIPSAIQTGKKYGMQSLDDAILVALEAKKVSPEDAYDKAIVKERFVQFLSTPPEFL